MTLSSAEKHSNTCPWKFPSHEDGTQRQTSVCSVNDQSGRYTSVAARDSTPQPLIFSLSLDEIIDRKWDNSIIVVIGLIMYPVCQ